MKGQIAMIRFTSRGVAVILLLAISPFTAGGADYKDADAAYRDGVAKLRDMKYDEARTPLEAALDLALDDEFRLKTYDALLRVYRRIPEAGPMIQAQEFVIRHSQRKTERRTAALDLTSFLHQRGLLDKQTELYEQQWKQNPDDLVCLSVLAVVYSRVKRDAAHKDEVTEQWEKAEKGLSLSLAEKLEKEAVASPQKAAQLWKDAAVAWRDAGQKEKAVAAADKAEKAQPQPSGLLEHFFHRHLGEVYADCGKNPKAIEHLQKAVDTTTIKGYQRDCQTRINELRALQVP